MTVAVNTTAMRSSAHGIGRYVGAMLAELLAADSDRYVIYSTPAHFSRWKALGAHRLRAAPSARGLRLLWEQLRLPALLRREGAAVLWGPAHAIPIWRTSRQVLTVHDLTWFNFPSLHTRLKGAYFRSMLRIATRRADLIVASSETTARDLERILHVPPERIRTILLAPDASFRPAPDVARNHVRIAYDLPPRFILALGVVEPRKNLLTLVRAVEGLARAGQEVPLVIAGSLDYGWQKDELLQAVKTSPARVRLLGRVPEADLAALISAATVLAYVPVAEGFGLPVLESMACGTPVVASTAPAIREVAGDAALLVDAHDVEAMSEALGRVARDASLQDRLRNSGFARAALFSWPAAAAALSAVFDELEKP